MALLAAEGARCAHLASRDTSNSSLSDGGVRSQWDTSKRKRRLYPAPRGVVGGALGNTRRTIRRQAKPALGCAALSCSWRVREMQPPVQAKLFPTAPCFRGKSPSIPEHGASRSSSLGPRRPALDATMNTCHGTFACGTPRQAHHSSTNSIADVTARMVGRPINFDPPTRPYSTVPFVIGGVAVASGDRVPHFGWNRGRKAPESEPIPARRSFCAQRCKHLRHRRLFADCCRRGGGGRRFAPLRPGGQAGCAATAHAVSRPDARNGVAWRRGPVRSLLLVGCAPAGLASLRPEWGLRAVLLRLGSVHVQRQRLLFVDGVRGWSGPRLLQWEQLASADTARSNKLR